MVVRECLEVEKHEVEFAYGRRLQWGSEVDYVAQPG